MTPEQTQTRESMLALADIRMRDPFILESPPGRFVLYGTTDENVWGGPATGFDCYTSTDLDLWSGPFPAFRPPAGFWADTQYWAPEVHALDGRFFLVGTFATSSGTRPRGVAILVSQQPTGPFVPWSNGPITPVDQACLDGTIFVDENGARWLVYSRGAEGALSGTPGIADGEMYAVQLSDDLRRAEGEPILLFTASAASWSRPLRFPDGAAPPESLRMAKDPLLTDGPFIVRAAGGSLLMLWSSFGAQGYAMGVARSASGALTGPWTQSTEPLWSENGGHGMVLRTVAGDHLVFHWPNDSPDERVRLVDLIVDESEIRLAPSAVLAGEDQA